MSDARTHQTHVTLCSAGSNTSFHLAVDDNFSAGMSLPMGHSGGQYSPSSYQYNQRDPHTMMYGASMHEQIQPPQAHHPHHYEQPHKDLSDAYSLTSRPSMSASTTDGIDILGGEPSPENFHQWGRLRTTRVVSSVYYKRTVLGLILATAIALGVRTRLDSDSFAYLVLERSLDGMLLLFTFEILLSIACYQEQMLKTGWLAFDILVVLLTWWTRDVSLLVLRAFRLLRALRKANGVPSLKWAVKAILRGLPRLTAVVGILLPGMVCIFAILFTNLYGAVVLSEGDFGRLDRTALTLFQIMTGGTSWSTVSAELQVEYPSAWFPMCCFMAVALFFFGTLIIAVMCDAVSTVNRDRLWKSLDNSTSGRNNAPSDPLLDDHSPPMTVQRLEQKIDQLTKTVDSLMQLQSQLQTTVNAMAGVDNSNNKKYSSSKSAASKASAGTSPTELMTVPASSSSGTDL